MDGSGTAANARAFPAGAVEISDLLWTVIGFDEPTSIRGVTVTPANGKTNTYVVPFAMSDGADPGSATASIPYASTNGSVVPRAVTPTAAGLAIAGNLEGTVQFNVTTSLVADSAGSGFAAAIDATGSTRWAKLVSGSTGQGVDLSATSADLAHVVVGGNALDGLGDPATPLLAAFTATGSSYALPTTPGSGAIVNAIALSGAEASSSIFVAGAYKDAPLSFDPCQQSLGPAGTEGFAALIRPDGCGTQITATSPADGHSNLSATIVAADRNGSHVVIVGTYVANAALNFGLRSAVDASTMPGMFVARMTVAP